MSVRVGVLVAAAIVELDATDAPFALAIDATLKQEAQAWSERLSSMSFTGLPARYDLDRNPEAYAIVCEPAGVLYAVRESRDELEQLLRDDRDLILRFGRPRILPPVVTRLRPT